MLIMPSFVFLTIRMFHAVNANANDENVRTEMFKTKGNTRVLLTENTTYVYSRSVISFANKCLSDPYCCLASYSKETSTCRIDSSRSCCTETEHQRDGGIFDESLIIIENCEGLGGKLAELETSEENVFIKDELRTRNTGVSGYWINGYKFYHDNNMEWASQPNQTMSFSDINPGEPDGPTDQLCMVMWKGFDFRWGDYHCYISLSYVCEFMHP